MARLLVLTFIAMLTMAAMALGSGALIDAASAGDAVPRAARQYGPDEKPVSDGSALVVNRDKTGQFRLSAQINGQSAVFLVDTGADVVALSVEEAERLELPVDRASFVPMMETASGTGYGTTLELREFVVAGHEFQNVEVVVLDGLKTNLLGQSVLRQLGPVELHGDQMTIGSD